MDLLNNREISIVIWLALALAWVLTKPSLRKSVMAVLKALFKLLILLPAVLQVIYMALAVYVLSLLSLWDVSQLKNTILWAVVVGFACMFRVATSDKNPNPFRSWIKDNLRLIVLVEFIANFYILPLLAELIIVPLVTFISGMLVIAENKKEYKAVATLLNWLISILGAAIFVYALDQFFSNPEEFAKLQTLQDFATPPLLSFVLIPFLFLLNIYVSYERAFLRLRFAVPDPELRKYARSKAILAFRSRVEMLKRWSRNIAISRPSDKAAVRYSILDVQTAWKREKNPPLVAAKEGWSPYAAITFLSEEGLVTDDYHRSVDGWFASSTYHDIGDEFPKDNVTYYVEGNEHAAIRLKLVLNVNNPDDPAVAEHRFRDLALALTEKALGDDFDERDISNLLLQDCGKLLIGYKEMRITRDNWGGGVKNGYDRRFVIDHISSTEPL